VKENNLLKKLHYSGVKFLHHRSKD